MRLHWLVARLHMAGQLGDDRRERAALLTAAFEGEAHGFRRAETQIAALESELSFYGQVFGFTPPGIPTLPLSTG